MKSYTFRVVPDENYTIDNIVEIFSQTIPKVSKLIICREGGHDNVKEHLHLSLVTPHGVHSVTKYKRTYFPKWNHTRNENFSHHVCDTCQSAKHGNCVEDGKTYTCKDGDVVFFQGYTQMELNQLISKGSSYERKVVKDKDTITNKIIKLLPPPNEWNGAGKSDGLPSGSQVLNAMKTFYGKNGRFLPQPYFVEKTLHSIRMTLDKQYREYNYFQLNHKWEQLGDVSSGFYHY